MQNLALHIVLPQGIKLLNGATLMRDITFDFISQLSPYYSSVDLLRLSGGPALARMSDIALACQIYNASLQADLISPSHPARYGPENQRFIGARMQYVTAKATHDQMDNVISLLGPSAHVLANFSVDRKYDVRSVLKDLKEDMALWEVAVRSGGRTMPGGRPSFVFAAKGVNDWSEATPGRTWWGNGIGANAKTMDMGSVTGGRGKPVSFAASPLCSPPFSAVRSGMFQPGYPIAAMYPGITHY